MVKALEISKNELLKTELKTRYANLTDAELNQIDESFEQFVDNMSLKTHKQREEVVREVEAAVAYAQSKSL